MGIERQVRSLRMNDEECSVFDRIQAKFWPFTQTFKDSVMLSGRVTERCMADGILEDVVLLCQRLQCIQHDKQLKLKFPPAVGMSFFPKINGGMR